MSTILTGHTSHDTAYVVEDYPYGFRLRCRIRYWLEYKPCKGFRLWSQTSNPKAGNGWTNKPKASTFSRFGGCMVLNAEGHVKWTSLTEYDDCKQLTAWRDTYGSAMPVEAQEVLRAWIARKLSYEQAKTEGLIRCTITTTQFGCLTDPGFGKPIATPTVETTVLKSDYTPAELLAMGQGLRGDTASQLGQLVNA